MTDQTNANTPVLPELKSYSVQNGEYVYLYTGHYKMGANGRKHFVKGPKSAGRIKPLDSTNNKYIVLWQDWFLDEHPELRSYNTYYEPVSTSKYSMAPQPCFSFSAKSGSSYTNSMNRQQYYEAGATWVFDQLLYKTPLLVALNHKFLKAHLSPELLSLTYFIALTENTNFNDYGRFAGRTRLATQEPFSVAEISTFLQSKCSSELIDFWSELYSRFEKEEGLSSNFWIIDTAYPNHLIEKLSAGEYVPYLEPSKDITSLINRFKRNQLFKEGSSLHNYQRLLERQPTRILTVANVTNGQAFTFTPYNLEQINSADLIDFVLECPMWQNKPVIETKTRSLEDDPLKTRYEVLTEDQFRPRFKGVSSPLNYAHDLQALHPSNLNISRNTVVINNNIDAKDRRDKVIYRPTSGIESPLSINSDSELTQSYQSTEVLYQSINHQEPLTKTNAQDVSALYTTSANDSLGQFNGDNNEQVNDFDVNKLQGKAFDKEQSSKEFQFKLKATQNSLHHEIYIDGQRGYKGNYGVLVTDRCAHITEQFDAYQKQHLPFLLQVLPESDLYQLCINKIVDQLVQPENYDAILNRSSFTVSLIDGPEEYADILSFIKHGTTVVQSEDKEESKTRSSRVNAIGSLFNEDKDSFASRVKNRAESDNSSSVSKESKQVKDLLQIQEHKETTPLTLHVCFDYRELIKLANSLESFYNFDKSETIVEQVEFDVAINSRHNDIKLKKDIIDRASGRIGQKPRYHLSDKQIDLTADLDDLIQKRNHVIVPEIAKAQRDLKVSTVLDEEEAELIAQPPLIDNWTTERELRLESIIRKLLQTKLPRSVLKLSITNCIPHIDDALVACNMLQTQTQTYERLCEDVLKQERSANNVLLSRINNNAIEQELAGKQFLWFLALNMKFMFNLLMEQSNRKNNNALELKKGVYTADEMLEHLRLITASRKEGGLEYPRTVNIKSMFTLLSYLGLQEPSTESFTTVNNNVSVPLMPDRHSL